MPVFGARGPARLRRARPPRGRGDWRRGGPGDREGFHSGSRRLVEFLGFALLTDGKFLYEVKSKQDQKKKIPPRFHNELVQG